MLLLLSVAYAACCCAGLAAHHPTHQPTHACACCAVLPPQVNKNGIALFRWMYFFCAWPVLWVLVNWANNRIFAFVEWLFYRDAITYLDRCGGAQHSCSWLMHAARRHWQHARPALHAKGTVWLHCNMHAL